jgi:hypothetical protein
LTVVVRSTVVVAAGAAGSAVVVVVVVVVVSVAGVGSVVGVGVGVVVFVVGAEVDGTVCTCWARPGVEESAKTAAIAVAPARAYSMLDFVIMPDQPACARFAPDIIANPPP